MAFPGRVAASGSSGGSFVQAIGMPAGSSGALVPRSVDFPAFGSHDPGHNLAVVKSFYAKGPEGFGLPPVGSYLWIRRGGTEQITGSAMTSETVAGHGYINYRLAQICEAAAGEDRYNAIWNLLYDEWQQLGVLATQGPAERYMQDVALLGVCLQDGPIDMLNFFPRRMDGAVRVGYALKSTRRPADGRYIVDAAGGAATLTTANNSMPLQLVPTVIDANADPVPNPAALAAGAEGLAVWIPIGDLDVETRQAPPASAARAYANAQIGVDSFMVGVTLVSQL